MRHLFVYEQSVSVNWSVEKGPLRYSAQGHKVQSPSCNRNLWASGQTSRALAQLPASGEMVLR